mgnify:CR=1 FL=1
MSQTTIRSLIAAHPDTAPALGALAWRARQARGKRRRADARRLAR